MSTHARSEYGELTSSPFFDVPRTPAVYHKVSNFASESPCVVPQLKTALKDPELNTGITQMVPITPGTITPRENRTTPNLFDILQVVTTTPKIMQADKIAVSGSQIVPSGFSPFVKSQQEILQESDMNCTRKTGDNEDAFPTKSQITDICGWENHGTTSCNCHLPRCRIPDRLKPATEKALKELNLFGGDDIFEQ